MTRIVLILLILAQPALADRKSDAAALFAEGQRRYEAEDYAGAAAKFVEAHQLDPDPAYLFNIAQAFRFGKRCTDATTYYKQFLADVPRAQNRDAVERYLQELAPCVVAETPPPQPPPPPPPPPPTPRYRLARNLALGLAAAGVATGTGFAIHVELLQRDRDALCNRCTWDDDKKADAASLDRRGRRSQAIEVTSFAIGGAALATAVLLHVLGAPERISATPTGVAVAF